MKLSLSRILAALAVCALAGAIFGLVEPVVAAVPTADVSLQIASSDTTPFVGQTVLVRARVRNFGPNDAHTLTLSVDHSGYTFADNLHTAPGWACADNGVALTCTGAELDAGTSALFWFDAIADQPDLGTFPRIHGVVASTEYDPKLSNNVATAAPTLP